jgi:hypothetical protein
MKVSFVIYGLSYMAVMAAFLFGASRAWWAILTVAVLGLWYLPFGTVINILVIVLLLVPPQRRVVN